MAVKPLLVELRTEEMPPLLLEKVAEDWVSNLINALADAGVCDKNVKQEHWSTPRRMAVLIAEVAANAKAEIREIRGPSKRISYKGNKATAALQGFLRSSKAQEKDLVEIEHKGEPYMAIRQSVGETPLGELLGPALEQAVSKIVAPRLMRGGAGQYHFVRPIRGAYAIHGKQVIKALAFGAPTLKYTLGHRFLSSGKISLANASDYSTTLLQHKVIVDTAQRADTICKQARKLEPEIVIDKGLLQEAANMCEFPVCYLAQFDEAFLKLPDKVIATCMSKHLRSFAVGERELRNKFIFVADNKPGRGRVLQRGLERVMHARLEDTQFIYDLDRKTSPDDLLERIDTINYVRGMGSMGERSLRISRLVLNFTYELGAENLPSVEHVTVASRYIKADLGTLLAAEYPDLEGHIGAELLDSLAEPVRELIRNHLNRKLDDEKGNHPRDLLVLILEIERLVTMAALMGLPKGSRDPQGLRRSMGRVIRILDRHGLANLDQLLRYAWEECHQAAEKHGALRDNLFVSDADELRCDIKRFAIERIANMAPGLLGRRIDKRMLNAIFAPLLEGCGPSTEVRVLQILMRVKGLCDFAEQRSQEFDKWVATAKRLDNISGKHPGGPVQLDLLKEPAEENLYDFYNECDAITKALEKEYQYANCYVNLAKLAPMVERFFDNVMVNVDDVDVRTNRLNLVHSVSHLMNKFSDTRKLYS